MLYTDALAEAGGGEAGPDSAGAHAEQLDAETHLDIWRALVRLTTPSCSESERERARARERESQTERRAESDGCGGGRRGRHRLPQRRRERQKKRRRVRQNAAQAGTALAAADTRHVRQYAREHRQCNAPANSGSEADAPAPLRSCMQILDWRPPPARSLSTASNASNASARKAFWSDLIFRPLLLSGPGTDMRAQRRGQPSRDVALKCLALLQHMCAQLPALRMQELLSAGCLRLVYRCYTHVCTQRLGVLRHPEDGTDAIRKEVCLTLALAARAMPPLASVFGTTRMHLPPPAISRLYIGGDVCNETSHSKAAADNHPPLERDPDLPLPLALLKEKKCVFSSEAHRCGMRMCLGKSEVCLLYKYKTTYTDAIACP